MFKMENMSTPLNTLGMSEPAPIDTEVPAGFIVGKTNNLTKKRKYKSLKEYILNDKNK